MTRLSEDRLGLPPDPAAESANIGHQPNVDVRDETAAHATSPGRRRRRRWSAWLDRYREDDWLISSPSAERGESTAHAAPGLADWDFKLPNPFKCKGACHAANDKNHVGRCIDDEDDFNRRINAERMKKQKYSWNERALRRALRKLYDKTLKEAHLECMVRQWDCGCDGQLGNAAWISKGKKLEQKTWLGGVRCTYKLNAKVAGLCAYK